MGLFEKLFKAQGYQTEVKPDLKAEKKEWFEEFACCLSQTAEEYFLMIIITKNSVSPLLYRTENGKVRHSNELTNEILKKYLPYFKAVTAPGVYIYRYSGNCFAEQKHIPYYNMELFDCDLCHLVLFQEYGLYPVTDKDNETLQASLKAEKIKDTLVYACYLNDTEKIMQCLSGAKKAQLDKKLQYVGTPLGICAENNNLQAFRAIAEKGADLNKISLADRPLKIAFAHSPDIVRYIYNNFREQFESEVKKEGFLIACHTTDIGLLELIRDTGCDMVCNKKAFPPLLSFADYNNTVGIQFLFDNGVSMDIVNSNGQTALDRAISAKSAEAAELLKKLS